MPIYTLQLPDDVDDRFDDILYTYDQLMSINESLYAAAHNIDHSRKKRKIVNFYNPDAPFTKWPSNTIPYLMHSDFSEKLVISTM